MNYFAMLEYEISTKESCQNVRYPYSPSKAHVLVWSFVPLLTVYNIWRVQVVLEPPDLVN